MSDDRASTIFLEEANQVGIWRQGTAPKARFEPITGASAPKFCRGTRTFRLFTIDYQGINVNYLIPTLSCPQRYRNSHLNHHCTAEGAESH